MKTKKVLRSLGYDVLGKIGHGAFGQVKLAKSEKYPDKVAIKIMDRKNKPSYIYKEYMPRELAILKTTRHPHIVHVHDIHVMPSGQVFIVMEAAAMDLNKKITQLRRIPPDLARLWFSQLISAMVYLHDKHIAHRDLKCHNVLLTADDQVRLTDFGLGCYTVGSPDLRNTQCGTPSYNAPEVLIWEPYDAKKSDVWSLGVILYTMITGSLPFKSITIKGLPRLHRKALKYPRKITVEEPCRDLISSMLCYNPLIRPSVATVQQHPWLQPKEQQQETVDETEAADTPSTEAETSLEKKGSESPENQTTEKTDDQQQEQVNKMQSLEKNSRVINESPETAADNEEGDPDKRRSINGIQQIEEEPQTSAASIRNDAKVHSPVVDGSRAGVEAVERVEEFGCLGCRPFCTAVKRAAKVCVVEPIVRASRAFHRKVKKLFRKNSIESSSSSDSQQSAPHPAGTTEAPAGEDVCPGLLEQARSVKKAKAQPKVGQGKKRMNFPTFKILSKKINTEFIVSNV